MDGVLARKSRVLAGVVIVMIVGLVGVSGDRAAQGASSKPVRRGTLTMLNTYSPATMDPIKGNGNQIEADGPISRSVYGQLLYLDDHSGAVVPDMAQSLTTQDGTVWELKIRSGIKFTDGTPYDAAAVQAQWQRVLDPANASRQLSLLGQVQSLQVSDPLTLRVTLKAPNGAWDKSIAASLLMNIASPTAVRALGSRYGTSVDTTVGAGAFVLKDWVRDSSIRLERNTQYFRKGQPYLDAIVFNLSTDDAQRYSAVQTGQADLSYSLTADWSSSAQSNGLQLFGIPWAGIQWIDLNVGIPPFNNAAARRALNLMIDPKQLNAIRYQGEGTPSQLLFRAGSPWNVPGAKIPTYNHKKAQKAVDAAVKQLGGPLNFQLQASPNTAPFAEQLQAMLASYQNVKLSIAVVVPAQYVATLQQKSFNAVILSQAWGLDPEPLLTQNFTTTGGTNYGGVGNPQLDALITKGRSETTVAARQKVYQDVFSQLVSQDMKWWLPAIPRPTPIIATKRVHGLGFSDRGVRFEQAWVQAP